MKWDSSVRLSSRLNVLIYMWRWTWQCSNFPTPWNRSSYSSMSCCNLVSSWVSGFWWSVALMVNFTSPKAKQWANFSLHDVDCCGNNARWWLDFYIKSSDDGQTFSSAETVHFSFCFAKWDRKSAFLAGIILYSWECILVDYVNTGPSVNHDFRWPISNFNNNFWAFHFRFRCVVFPFTERVQVLVIWTRFFWMLILYPLDSCLWLRVRFVAVDVRCSPN